jgi:hypothetical protein
MQRYQKYSYGLLWALIALVVLALISFVFMFRPPQAERITLDPASYTPPEARLEAEREEAGEDPLLTDPPDVSIKETEIVLSSPDGEIQMRLSSGEASSKEGVVSLPEAELEFYFKDRRKLYLLARDLTYTLKEEVAEVSGALSGEMPSLKMRFTAEGVVWNQRESALTLKRATLVDPAFEVDAQDILVDVKQDTLQVLGGVRVNL